jgi:subtilisin family serine protease
MPGTASGNGSVWNGYDWTGSTWSRGAASSAQAWLAETAPSGNTFARSANVSSTPPDPGAPYEWGLGAINATGAYARMHSNVIPTLCVVDSGVDGTHPDLAPNMVVRSNGTYGFDATSGAWNGSDVAGHGTHVAGIAAAVIGNGVGVTGTAPAGIVSVRVLNANGTGYESDLANGINDCVKTHASVITMSVGTPIDSPAVRAAVKSAWTAGAVLVASMGNDGCACKEYPAAYPNVIAVGAMNETGNVANFSDTGTWISLVAPGVHILSTYKGGVYRVGSGTSQAAPYVAGVALLVRSANPGLTNVQVRSILLNTAHPLGAGTFSATWGYGLVDAGAAVSAAEVIH